MKKYKLLKTVGHAFGFKYRQLHRKKTSSAGLVYVPRRYYRFSAEGIKSDIESFYIDDSNSRASAGKRETITHKKDKRLKRYFNNSVKNLHKKFCTEKDTSLIQCLYEAETILGGRVL